MTKSEFNKLWDECALEQAQAFSKEALKEQIKKYADENGKIPNEAIIPIAIDVSTKMSSKFLYSILSKTLDIVE